MELADFIAAVAGKRIVNVEVDAKDSMGNPPAAPEVIIRAIELDDGSKIWFEASGQVGYSDVWASVTLAATAAK